MSGRSERLNRKRMSVAAALCMNDSYEININKRQVDMYKIYAFIKRYIGSLCASLWVLFGNISRCLAFREIRLSCLSVK